MFTDTQTDYFCFTEQTKFFHSTLEEAFSDKIAAIILKSFSYSSCASTINTIYEDKDFSISDKTVSRYAKAITEKLKCFNSSPLPSSLFTVYLDTTYLPFHLPNNSIRKVGLSIALGLNTELIFQVLAYTLCSHETQKIYTELLNNIKSRGVDSVAVIVGDGMPVYNNVAVMVYAKFGILQDAADVRLSLLQTDCYYWYGEWWWILIKE